MIRKEIFTTQKYTSYLMKNSLYPILFSITLLLGCYENHQETSNTSNDTHPTQNQVTEQITHSHRNETLVLRTDYTNQNSWEKICQEIKASGKDSGFSPDVYFLSDRKYENFTLEEFNDSFPDYGASIIFIVDSISMSHPDNLIHCIYFEDTPGDSFRSTTRHIWSIENNINTANMDFETFKSSLVKNGIFNGF